MGSFGLKPTPSLLLTQGDHSLEVLRQGFVELVHLIHYDNDSLCIFFWAGLNPWPSREFPRICGLGFITVWIPYTIGMSEEDPSSPEPSQLPHILQKECLSPPQTRSPSLPQCQCLRSISSLSPSPMEYLTRYVSQQHCPSLRVSLWSRKEWS